MLGILTYHTTCFAAEYVVNRMHFVPCEKFRVVKIPLGPMSKSTSAGGGIYTWLD